MDSESSCEVIYKHCFMKLKSSIRASKVDSKVPLIGYSREKSWSIGKIPLEITIGDAPLTRKETLNFVIIKSDSPYNMLLGRTAMQKMGIVVSTIHEAIKFHTTEGMTHESDKVKEGMKKVKHQTWVANLVMVKKSDGGWRMCVDFININKACPKDCYPLPEIDWKVESLSGFRLKCFLDAYKGYHQIQMAEGDEDKTIFFAGEGVFCYQKMPFGLKNAEATYQRLVDKVFHDQIRRNLEAYVNDMVLKSTSEEEILADIKETFEKGHKCSFVRKREKEQVPIYFVSRVLQGTELNYPGKENLILALVHAARRTDADRPRGKRIYLCLTLRIQNNKQQSRIRNTIGRVTNITRDGNYKLGNFLDSQLLVNQIKGTYAAKQPTIKEYLQKTKEALKDFDSYTIEHIRRNQNKKADALSKMASMTFEHLTKKVMDEVLPKQSIEEKEILHVETKEGESWMTPIHEYLVSGLLPEDPKESRKIRVKAPQYNLIRGNLYRRSFYTTWLRCVASPQTDDIVKEVHKGSCGFNAEPRSMVVRITKQGYYWPSMHRDTTKVLQDCEKCKEQSAIRKVAESNVITAGSGWSFSHWGVNILGPLPTAPGGFKFLAIVVEHSTKLVEAKPLTVINGRHAERFIWEYIVCRFRVPRIISSKDEKHFREGIFVDLCKGLKITQSFSPITEHTEIINHIKKLLARSQQGWADDLAQVLWVHRTLSRNSQKDTPFSITYGSEAIIHISKNDVAKDDRGRIKEVDKRRGSKKIASIEKAYYRSKLRRHHYKRISYSIYKIGDFVLLSQNNTGSTQGFTTEASVGGDIRLETGTEDGVAL
ncbi:reverse transcriptase domain-containing protein [Tanacetum coccineum]